MVDNCTLLDVTKYDHRLWDCGDDLRVEWQIICRVHDLK